MPKRPNLILCTHLGHALLALSILLHVLLVLEAHGLVALVPLPSAVAALLVHTSLNWGRRLKEKKQ